MIVARWGPWSGEGLEHLELNVTADAVTADGVVVGATDDGLPFAARYRLTCDGGWRVRSLSVDVVGAGCGLVLVADGAGSWATAAGEPLPGLAGAIDVDLSVSPFTNTLPIRRLDLAAGAGTEIAVAYVHVPDLSVECARQRYTRPDTDARYRFESLGSDFAADIDVDGQGLVVTYPGLFRRTL
ncbi:putative glycolipid-binding domain-containing protein [Azospirillum halopraeferens]|uniref:putative glycolipid-binding domain-containing protein n=1 Tax=Azospirillum halopraeferens TaxID=34010 RepID=UPI000422F165|nr:putative glycolipid-binding domain-containing protein [Azospirillum halopraeferens]